MQSQVFLEVTKIFYDSFHRDLAALLAISLRFVGDSLAVLAFSPFNRFCAPIWERYSEIRSVPASPPVLPSKDDFSGSLVWVFGEFPERIMHPV
ncbi:MAG: hypothetical protein HYS38_00200 [Acidobacteria bacterium]|nr:hypothetical protein [Acidobacteriota bacterium]